MIIFLLQKETKNTLMTVAQSLMGLFEFKLNNMMCVGEYTLHIILGITVEKRFQLTKIFYLFVKVYFISRALN